MRKLFGKADRYILSKFFTTYLVVILSFVVIAVIFDIAEKVDDFIKGNASFYVIVTQYYFNFIPFYVIMLTPLLLFISIVFFTSRMSANNEIIALLNAGVTYRRLMFPYMAGSALICGLNIYANHFILPVADRNRILFEDEYIHDHNPKTEINKYMQIAKNTYMYLQNYNSGDSSGFQLVVDKFENRNLVASLKAERIKWIEKKKEWKLNHFQLRRNNGMIESLHFGIDSLVSYNFSPADFEKKTEEITALTTPQLNRTVEEEILKGAGDVPYYYIEKYKRTAFPFAIFILTIIAFSISTRKVRGGTGLHLFLGIALSFSYILFQQFFSVFSTNSSLPAALGVWIPNIIYAVIAFFLYRIAPK